MELKHQQKLTHQQLNQEKKLRAPKLNAYVMLDGNSRAKGLIQHIVIAQIKFVMPKI